MWPSFDEPGTGLTTEQLVSRGKRTIIAPALTLAVIVWASGLLVGGGMSMQQRVGGQHSWWPAVILFGCLGLGFATALGWNALMAPRWWDWAVQSGVDLEALLQQASDAQLVSRTDSWWQERDSTKAARAAENARRAL